MLTITYNTRYINMKLNIFTYFSCCILFFALSGCKPEKLDVELYTSDIQKASTAGIMQVPVTMIFSLYSNDNNGDLVKASAIARHFLNAKAQIKIVKEDLGDAMLIKATFPMGTQLAVDNYLTKHPRPLALIIKGNHIQLSDTHYLDNLNAQLQKINPLLSIEAGAKSTFFHVIGDMSQVSEIKATAVFIDQQPKLYFKNKVARRDRVSIEFKGEKASVYSQIPPQINIQF